MAAILICPDRQTLEQFFLGHVPEPHLSELFEHVDGCEHCLDALQTLQPLDTLAQTAASLGRLADPASDEMVRSLMRKLRQATTAEPPAQASAPLTDAEATADSSNPAQHTEPGGGELDTSFLAPPQSADEIGRLGPYRILSVLGHGGMGVVFKAEDPKLQRVVALKAMKPSVAANANAGKRFLREARTMAAVKHDHIATIYQVDEDRGVPYLAMEFLDGEPLDKCLKRAGKLPIHEVLRIGREIAQGLAAAHARGLIHRDIMPGNVWLETRSQESGVRNQEKPFSPGSQNRGGPNPTFRVKILDFGLARAENADSSQVTQQGVIVGTPAYMAPEQGKGGQVDARADLFSLGCVLYVMSTGKLPFTGGDAVSTLLAVAMEQPPSPQTLNAEVPAELSDLILKLLAKKPEERYQSAHEVVEALTRIETVWRAEGRQPPVSATVQTPHSTVTDKTAAQPGAMNPGAYAPRLAKPRRWLIAAAMLLLILGPLGWFFGATIIRFANNQGELVIQVEDKDIDVKIVHNGVQVEDKPNKRVFTLSVGKGEIEVLEKDGVKLATKKFELTRGGRTTVTVTWAELAKAREPKGEPGALATGRAAQSPLEKLDPAKIPAEDRYDWQPKELVAVLGEHRGRSTGQPGWATIAVSTDGKLLAFSFLEGPTVLCDAQTLRVRRELGGAKDRVLSLAFTADNTGVVSGGNDGTVRVWDVASGKETSRLTGHTGPVTGIAIASNGRQVLSGSHDKTVRLWDLETRKELKRFEGHTTAVQAVAFSRDSRLALSAGGKLDAKGPVDCALRVWNVETGMPLPAFEESSHPICRIAVSPNNRSVACAVITSPGDLRVFDVDSRKQTTILAGGFAAFSPDGRWLVTSHGKYDAQSLRCVRELPAGFAPAAVAGTFFPDNRRVAIASGNIVRLWDSETGQELRPPVGHTAAVNSVSFSSDGGQVLTASLEDARLWDLATGKEKWIQQTPQTVYLGHALFSPDWKHAVLHHDPAGRPSFSVVDVASGRRLHDWTPDAGTTVLSPDQRRLVTIADFKTVRIWDVQARKAMHEINYAKDVGAHAARFSHDSRYLYCMRGDNQTSVIDSESGKEVRRFKTFCQFFVYTSDGRTAYGYYESRIWRVDLSGPDPKHHEFLRWHDGANVNSIALSPDGKTLISSDTLGRVIVWDTAKGDKTREWKIEGGVNSVAIAPDGRHIATANGNGTIYIMRLGYAPAAMPGAANVAVKPAPLPELKGGEPLNSAALVQRPAKIKGVRSWTIETVKPRGVISSAQYSADGKLVSMFSEDGSIRVLDAVDGRLVRVFAGLAVDDGYGFLNSMYQVWSPRGQILASSSRSDKAVRLWDVQTGALLATWQVPKTGAWGIPICWSPDATKIAVASADKLEIRDVATGKLVRSAECDLTHYRCVTWSQDGKWIAVGPNGSPKADILLFNADTLKLQTMPSDGVSDLAWSLDSKRLFTNFYGSTQCWDLNSDKRVWGFSIAGGVGRPGMALSPDGTIVTTANRLLDAATGKARDGILPGVAKSWAPNGKTIVVLPGNDDAASPLHFWDVAAGQVVKTVAGLPHINPHYISWSLDGKAVGEVSRKLLPIRFWEVDAGRPVLKTPPSNTRAYSRDGKLRCVISDDGDFKIVESSTGMSLNLVETGPLHFMTNPWSADGSRFAVNCSANKSAPAAHIWDLRSGKRLHSLKVDDETPLGMAFSPDVKFLATGGKGIVRLWDAESGARVDTLRGHTGDVDYIVWSADGKTLTSSADDGMRDWDVTTGKLVRHRPWRMGWPSPDGRFGSDAHVNTIRVWDLETGQRRLTIMPLPDDRFIAFSPDGHYRGSRAVERDIVYVAQLDDGRQETLTPEEFSKRFGWKNEPEKVGLAVATKSVATAVPAANANPDRRAAEWFLSIGGNIKINENGQERDI